MVSQKTQDNIDEIVELISKAEGYNGQQRSMNINMDINQINSNLIALSDGDVGLYFEGQNNTNSRLGAYKITLKCTDEVQEFVDSNRNSNEVENT